MTIFQYQQIVYTLLKISSAYIYKIVQWHGYRFFSSLSRPEWLFGNTACNPTDVGNSLNCSYVGKTTET
jgi:hypothetical protein